LYRKCHKTPVNQSIVAVESALQLKLQIVTDIFQLLTTFLRLRFHISYNVIFVSNLVFTSCLLTLVLMNKEIFWCVYCCSRLCVIF